jgi:hypothetical protein
MFSPLSRRSAFFLLYKVQSIEQTMTLLIRRNKSLAIQITSFLVALVIQVNYFFLCKREKGERRESERYQ